jgi:Zn finger protein HypA/HybF involved in hydrogenase expression
MTRIPNLDRVDPWRYACPTCGSFELYFKQSADKNRTRNYPHGEAGKRLVQADRNATFRCDDCSTHMDRVYDRRKGTEVSRV